MGHSEVSEVEEIVSPKKKWPKDYYASVRECAIYRHVTFSSLRKKNILGFRNFNVVKTEK